MWKHLSPESDIQIAQPSIGVPYPATSASGALTQKMDRAAAGEQARSLGWLPGLSVVGALGLFLIAWAYTGSRAGGVGWAEPLFWTGLLVMFISFTVRLASVQAAPAERVGLVVFLGLVLYLVKVIHSPVAFTFPDELIHFRNVAEMLSNQRLFSENPILPVTPLYPGLETVTAALATLSGLTPFAAGVVVVGAARLVLLLAFYLFYQQVSGSARVAGVAAAIYMANSNFLYWSAQFSYESMALPVAGMALFAVTRRESMGNRLYYAGFTVVALLAILTVVITHHITSYMLVAMLWAMAMLYPVYYRRVPAGLWILALIALAATGLWLIFMASLTVAYLWPILGGAISSIIRMLLGEEIGRQLFQSSSGYVSPLWERVIGLGSVLLILLGLLLGLRQIWQQYRDNVVALILTLAALTYFPLQALRLTPAGWETSNRASEFLFVGISLVVALALAALWQSPQLSWLGRVSLTVCIAVIFAGGVIAGWQPNLRLARPYLVEVGSQIIEPQGVTTANWTRSYLDPNNRIAADTSNAKLLVAYSHLFPYTGTKFGIKNMILSDWLKSNELHTLRITGVRYVVVDRRLISWDHMVGLYFDQPPIGTNQKDALIDPAVYQKFDTHQKVSRIFDSGNIVIYYVGALVDDPSIQ